MTTHNAPSKSGSSNRAALLRLAARMAEEMELIGGRMRERRDELGLTQRDVADLIPGKTEGKDVSRWERGLHRPNTNTLSLIAKALKTNLADLYAGPVADREEQGPTPDVLRNLNGDPTQLDRIEAMLTSIRDHFGIEEEEDEEEPAPERTFVGRLSARDDAEAPTTDEQAQREADELGTAEEGR